MNDSILMSILLSNLREIHSSLSRATRLNGVDDTDYWWGKIIAIEEVLYEYAERHALEDERKEIMSLIGAFRKVYGNE